ncbi:MAG: hypothetical protein MJ050_07200 [Phascolarctobacterium sp.]|nr:hypothetical protein [Phascolarctobacterium sp.]
MNCKKHLTIATCLAAFLTTQVAYAADLAINKAYAPVKNLEQISTPTTEVISYGLLPNPFKIVTAPVRAAKAKIKAAKKAAKLAKKATHAAKEIGGDNEGKEPTGDYERTPYTKDRYYQKSKKKKESPRPVRKSFEDYEFENNTTSPNNETIVISRNPINKESAK